MRELILQQETLLHLLRLQAFQLVQSDTHHPTALPLLLIPTTLQSRQTNILLAEPTHPHVVALFEYTTSLKLVLAHLHALPRTTLFFLLLSLRQAAVFRPSGSCPNGTGGKFDDGWNFLGYRLVEPGRLTISCACYRGFGSASLPLRRFGAPCFL